MMCAMEETSDTLTLAAEERNKQGIHELEISFGGELDLHKHFHKCGKNPGHPDFIPVNKLQERHLPKHRYSHKITEYVRQISDLTVKLSVKYVSPNRPPGYPLSDRAGQRVLSVGSGLVADISLRENSDKLPCPLKNCGHRPGYHVASVYMIIVTAAHVVFDDEEAENTTVEFFYDDSSDRSRVMTASGVRVEASSVEGDFCALLCVSHETKLFCMLKYKMCTMTVRAGWRVEQSKKELEIFLSGEIDFTKYFNHFENSEPVNIIPVNKLEERPPPKHRHSHKIPACFREIHLTVVLSVNYVSPNRPSGYPLSDRAGQRVLSVGRGFVTDISLTENNGKLPCPLKICGHGPGYHEVCGYITIVTAAHVVFDDEEAKNTTVEFFYDDSWNRSGVMRASGVRVAASSVEGDFCALLCVTHERKLFQTLKHEFFRRGKTATNKALCQPFETLLPGLCGIEYGPAVNLEFNGNNRLTNPDDSESEPDDSECEPDDSESEPDDMFLVHIAHPHGQSKHVTIGRQMDCFIGDGFYHQLYTAPTCPGCSGGPVWTIPASGDLSEVYGVPHSGCLGNQLNKGCSWTIYPLKREITI